MADRRSPQRLSRGANQTSSSVVGLVRLVSVVVTVVPCVSYLPLVCSVPACIVVRPAENQSSACDQKCPRVDETAGRHNCLCGFSRASTASGASRVNSASCRPHQSEGCSDTEMFGWLGSVYWALPYVILLRLHYRLSVNHPPREAAERKAVAGQTGIPRASRLSIQDKHRRAGETNKYRASK